jgi:hypothetical protein
MADSSADWLASLGSEDLVKDAVGWRDYNGSRAGCLAETRRRLSKTAMAGFFDRLLHPYGSWGLVQDVADWRDCTGRRLGQTAETDLVA